MTSLDRTVYEDQASFIGGNIVVQDTESATFGTPVTVTITAPSGTLGIGGADVNTSAAGSRAGYDFRRQLRHADADRSRQRH